MTPVIQIIQALEAKLARAPIVLKGFQLDKDGNLIRKPARMSVSDKIRQTKSKRVRVSKRTKGAQKP